MDAPLIDGEDSNLYDVMGSDESPNPDTQLMLDSLREEIRRALDTLTPREARCCFFLFWIKRRTRNDS